MSRLSVITPNFNHGAFVAQAVEGVMGQGRPPDEYLIVDDASTDDSLTILSAIASRAECIRLIRHIVNQGAAASSQELLTMARGEYVYGAGADDFVLPGMFEQVMHMADRFDRPAIIFGEVLGMDAAGRVTRRYAAPWKEACYLAPDEFRDFCDSSPSYRSFSPSAVYRRDCLLEVGGFREELGHWADTFAMRAIAFKYGACYVPQPLVAWRRLLGSLSHDTRGNLRKKLAIVARAAALMRSAEFRDRFPEPHVRRWERHYRRSIYLHWAKSVVTASWQRAKARLAA